MKWFKNLNIGYKIGVILIIVLLTVLTISQGRVYYYKLQLVNEKAKQFDVIEDEKRDLYLQLDSVKLLNDALKRKSNAVIRQFNAIKSKLEKQQHETNNVPSAVALYTEQQLDSTISNYRHIQRTKD